MNAKTPDSERTALDFKVLPVMGGAIASVVGAVVGSRLGVAGTLVGAAVTSLVVGFTSQFATFGLARSHEGLKVVTRHRPGTGEADPDGESDPAGDLATEESEAAQEIPGRPGRRRISPKLLVSSILATAAAVFVLALGAITVFEATIGRSVDGSHSTTLAGAAAGVSAQRTSDSDPEPQTTVTVTTSASARATATPTRAGSPTATATPTASATPFGPTASAVPTTPVVGTPAGQVTPKDSQPA